jgi:TrpR family trp operon transcriptional repressor
VNKNDKNDIDEISELIVSSKDKEEVMEYLKSLLTPAEIKGIALRWEILKGLYEGKSQRKVAEELGVSLCNVTRGARELKPADSTLRKFLKQYFSR